MQGRPKGIRWQVTFLFSWLCHSVSGQIHYSIVEEMRKGSVVGNLAKDLGMNIKDLSARKIHIVSDVSEKYFHINPKNGDLYIADKIDRETLCGAAAECALTFDAVAENPLNIFSVKIAIQDINDNPPRFIQDKYVLQMSEHTLPGAKFNLKNAIDLDIGINGLKGYRLSANQHFVLSHQTDGIAFPELVLEKPLDREAQSSYELILTAVDGGIPAQTGTTLIQISVTDINDNTPTFTQNIYKVQIKESMPLNSTVLQVSANDADEGVNGQITYSFNTILNHILESFTINPSNGEIKTKEHLDYEVTKNYEFTVEAKDGGGLVSNAKVLIDILDENDNVPDISITSLSSPVPEDTEPGTVVSLIAVRDKDSGPNGEVQCQVIGDAPFQLISSASNFYKIVTKSSLDREQTSSYNITIQASDKGSPPLFSEKMIQVDLSDVNDNAPVFEKWTYDVYVPENNLPGVSIFSIQAKDIDSLENAKLTYSVVSNTDGKDPSSLHVSINPVTGVIYAQKSFDYEQNREFIVQVVAKDSGSPPMNASTTLRIHVVDQNDNPPVILYPATMDGPIFEMVPWSSEQGSLISKVVAVDADSGHNAWLSYFLQSSESSVFTIDQHTGEIRTSHVFQERDVLKHKVTVIVKDNGFPPLSASATLNLVVGDSFQQVIPKISSQSNKLDSGSNLQIYLVVALALISFLFLLTVIFAIISKYRESKYASSFGSVNANLYPTIDPRFISQFKSGTLQLPYSYDVCVTLDSRKNDFAYLRPQSNVPVDHLIDADDSGLGNESSKDSLLAENISPQAGMFDLVWW
uniref:Cadherin domain-containing protein n=1 Tax=Pyxicephalus adspersus TaxID=30357 RepID=A0AAV3ASV9_PYXAD|nr:TPA: hypothetical protein GDO54_006619 [Pyxicephalus adspersus]